MHADTDITVGQAASLPADGSLAITGQHAARPNTGDRRRRRWSWRLSRWLHGLVVGTIAAEFLLGIRMTPLVAERPRGQTIELAAACEPILPPPSVAMIAGLDDPRPDSTTIIADEIASQSRAIAPQLAQELLDPAATSPTASAWLQQRMLDEIAAAERVSLAEQRQRLAQLGQQLQNISTPESVDAINGQVGALLGASGRASQPAAEPVAGDFDHDTAQFHDVKRTENAAGGFDYVAVLVDSAGRTMETSLTEAEGAQLYKTFEIIKANPLLERIYRGAVMSLIDKLMRPGSPPTEPAAKASGTDR